MKRTMLLSLITAMSIVVTGCTNLDSDVVTTTPSNYINSSWDFSLDIPAAYHVFELNNDNASLIQVVKNSTPDDETPLPEMNIEIEKSDKVTISTSQFMSIVNEEAVTINGVQGVKYNVSSSGIDSQCPIYLLNDNGVTYEFSLYECLESDIFEKIVRSFKPIEMTTFAIKELGITFNIPAIYKDDLAYSIESDGKGGLNALMYSKNMKQKGAACSLPGSLGWISKNKIIYDAHGEKRDFNALFDVKIGDEYVTMNSTGDVCYGAPGADKELKKDYMDRVLALRKAVSTIEGMEWMVEDLGGDLGTDMTGWKTVITYPLNEGVIEGRTVKIKGTAKPNSYLWAFVTKNAPGGREADRECLSEKNSNGDEQTSADGQTDAQGNFEFTLDEPCSKNVWLYVASEDSSLGSALSSTNNNWQGLCQSDSERIGFTLSGELPASCNK